MKKLLALLCAMVVFSAGAQTTNWYVDGNLYQTTTCTSGDDVTPPTAPAKYGYTFVGWFDNSPIVGTWTQSGTPSPTNPVYPTFYQDGDLILRAVGTGDNLIADTYNTETDKITRHVGVKVLDGTENWIMYNSGAYFNMSPYAADYTTVAYCSHYKYAWHGISIADMNNNEFAFGSTNHNVGFKSSQTTSTLSAWTTWLASQYAAGTPVTIYYPLATPTEETYTPAQ